jgi:hypothetical protein
MTVYEVVLTGTQDAEPMLSVLHYNITGSADLQAFTDAVRTELSAGLAALVVPSVTWLGNTIRLDEVGSVGVFYPFTSGQLIGTNAAGTYASNVAALIRKFSDDVVRPTQGRVFQGGIPTSAMDSDGKLTSGYVGSLVSAWELMRVIEFDGTGEGVMQIKASNPTAPNTQPYSTVARIGGNVALSTQRRRNFGT